MVNNESNNIAIKRPLSKKNKYYIPYEQYLELRHFCLQYNDWKKIVEYEKNVDIRRYYTRNMRFIEMAAVLAGGDLSEFLLLGVTEDYGYVYLKAMRGIPCCKETYYKCYRRFFYELALMKMQAI